jgi:hypothetical protein
VNRHCYARLFADNHRVKFNRPWSWLKVSRARLLALPPRGRQTCGVVRSEVPNCRFCADDCGAVVLGLLAAGSLLLILGHCPALLFSSLGCSLAPASITLQRGPGWFEAVGLIGGLLGGVGLIAVGDLGGGASFEPWF